MKKEWSKMRFTINGVVKGLIWMVLLVLPLSGLVAFSGCAGHTRMAPPAELVHVGNDSGNGQIKLTWDDAPGAVSYYLYVSKVPEARKHGERFVNVANPVTITNLKAGATYYFVVTSVRNGTESVPSEEISYFVGD
jgi:fibronectin type 3 domain-containing protein